jgi:hypothetical protein
MLCARTGAASRERREPQAFADRTMALLTTHWRAVEALASVLAQERCIEGADRAGSSRQPETSEKTGYGPYSLCRARMRGWSPG